MGQLVVLRIVQVFVAGDAQQALHLEDTLLGELHTLGAQINHEVALRVFNVVFFDLVGRIRTCRQITHQRGKSAVFLATLLGWARDNQRCACFVDENVVDFVNNCVVEWPLNELLFFEYHVVTQVIEADFAVGGVGDVGVVGLTS